MRWSLVALYVKESAAAADVFGKGLAQLRQDKKLNRLILPYHPADSRAVASISNRTQNSARACAQATKKKELTSKAKPPALYEEGQAAQGKIEYLQNCGMCHGPLLDGQRGGFPGPALKGKDFADPSYDFHVDEIFRFVAKLMPAATPGSLSNDQNVNIMAYILQQNGYPAGDTDLTYEEATNSRVPIRYYGP